MSEIEDRRKGYRALEEECERLRAEIDYRDRALIRMTAINDELVKAYTELVKALEFVRRAIFVYPQTCIETIDAALAKARG